MSRATIQSHSYGGARFYSVRVPPETVRYGLFFVYADGSVHEDASVRSWSGYYSSLVAAEAVAERFNMSTQTVTPTVGRITVETILGICGVGTGVVVQVERCGAPPERLTLRAGDTVSFEHTITSTLSVPGLDDRKPAYVPKVGDRVQHKYKKGFFGIIRCIGVDIDGVRSAWVELDSGKIGPPWHMENVIQ